MKIVLIGNYPPDRQESMVRFALMLHKGFLHAGFETEIWHPKVLFGSYAKNTTLGIGKWLGYLDKWILFPIILRWRLSTKKIKRSVIRYHVCDHSNAPYLSHLPSNLTGITCHDVIAIRGALGYADAHCAASGFGKVFQKWILHHLSRAKLLSSVSHMTLNQLNELEKNKGLSEKDWRVIHCGFNEDFRHLTAKESEVILRDTKLKQGVSFILHVGSDLPRKNRKLLVDMAHVIGSKWAGFICFAGDSVDKDLIDHAKSLGLENRIISIKRPDHNTLLALYSTCDAFIFPSFSEGFGMPLIEAQACGAPVIASNIEPMPEISGGTALHADPANPKDFAEAFLLLKDEIFRARVIREGYENTRRFQPTAVVNSYLELHGLEGTKHNM